MISESDKRNKLEEAHEAVIKWPAWKKKAVEKIFDSASTKPGPPTPAEHEENIRQLIVYHMSEIERLTEQLDRATGTPCTSTNNSSNQPKTGLAG